jgi:UDPglucose 6-dehydrogenase
MLGRLAHLNVAVLGSGPRALASAICLSRHHRVLLGEAGRLRAQRRLARLPMHPEEPGLDELMRRVAIDIGFTDSYASALDSADLVVIAEQPAFQPAQRRFDLSAIEACLAAVARRRPRATVVLEAPTPVGYAIQASQRHRLQVIPAPLLLRPGRMAWDRARPQRVVVGDVSERGLAYAFLAVRSCGDPNTPYLLTHPSEAEAIHALERRRGVRGASETREMVIDYCRRRRLNEEQVLRAMLPLDYVHESLGSAPPV